MSIQDWNIQDYAAPLRTLEPTDDDSDLAALRDIVGDARVVAIGETSHGITECYRVKDRLLRFLVRELGFSALVLESGFAEGLAVDDWVRGGPGDVASVAATGITYGFGECPEMRDTLRWMREHNAGHGDNVRFSGDTVRFYGMDVPGGCANPSPGVAACLRRLPAGDGDAELLALADLGERGHAQQRFDALSEVDRARLVDGVAGLAERAGDDEIARYCAYTTAGLIEHLRTGANPRDEIMAELVRWILRREGRIVLSAHNGHVQRAPLFGGTSLGQHLAAALGDELVVIGTSVGSGELPDLQVAGDPPRPAGVTVTGIEPLPGTIDALLAAHLAPGTHLLDLRRVPAGLLAGATAIRMQTMAVEVDLTAAFDALVHIGEITAAPDVVAAMHRAITG